MVNLMQVSRIIEAKASPTPPVAILQPAQVVAVVTWGWSPRSAMSYATSLFPRGAHIVCCLCPSQSELESYSGATLLA